VRVASLDAQVRTLRDVSRDADPRTRSLLSTVAVRALGLIATAVTLAGDVLPGIEHFPPM
jgi:hypothetical protein